MAKFRWNGKLVALGAIAFFFWAIWDSAPREFRQKLTLVVDTPEGIRTGSSVTTVHTSFQDGFPSRYFCLGQCPPAATFAFGEAVVVDLGVPSSSWTQDGWACFDQCIRQRSGMESEILTIRRRHLWVSYRPGS